ncbi:MAG: thiamine pyrophosphate-dependent dehydrogenase E1 component subunit alpha [Gammaproteobacteria bacterium]|nr:thiamine pyrophosphate-dependent dehydrogenase E1 component subunit alpha [Gammaproteobacteria bacterium]
MSLECLNLLKMMRVIRYSEEQLGDDFADGKLPGGVHLSVGQEAVAAGICAHLTDRDQVSSNHRGHGHFLAKGGTPKQLFAEIHGKDEGSCRGMGGSLHVADYSKGIIGANGIVGAGLPIATGAALANQMDNDGSMTVVFFGDGAANQGVLQESMNFAALWGLPLLYVCENNQFGQFSPTATETAGTISERAKAFEIPVEMIDGNDVRTVWQTMSWATDHIRVGKGPVFIEADTYRIRNHFERENLIITNPYRTEDEIEQMRRERDPIQSLENWLTEENLADRETITAIDNEAKAAVEEAAAFAEAGTLPPNDAAEQYMFAGTYS